MVHGSEFAVHGFGNHGSGLKNQGSVFMVACSGFMVHGSSFGGCVSWFVVHGSRFGIHGSWFVYVWAGLAKMASSDPFVWEFSGYVGEWRFRVFQWRWQDFLRFFRAFLAAFRSSLVMCISPAVPDRLLTEDGVPPGTIKFSGIQIRNPCQCRWRCQRDILILHHCLELGGSRGLEIIIYFHSLFGRARIFREDFGSCLRN